MPLPSPVPNETDKEFIERCMIDSKMIEEFEDEKQRYAVCNNKLENKSKMKKDEKRHIKEITEDEETITIVYGKSEEFEGINIDTEATETDEVPLDDTEEADGHLDEEIEVDEEVEIDDEEEDRYDDEDEEDRDEHMEEEIEEEEEVEEEIEEEIEDEEEEEEEDEDEEEEERNIWDKKDLTEKRFFNVETRLKTKGNKKIVEGHAAVYNDLSEDLGGFREKISPGAFDNVLDNDIRAFFNHDPNFLLARTTSGTLKVSTDKRGLKYSFEVPDTTAGRDLLVSMERGDITQSSFAFQVEKDSWSDGKTGEIRTIEKVARLFDVSPVSIPAYPSANDLSIAKRSKMIYKDKQKLKNEREHEIRMNLLELKINILKRK